MAKNEDIDKAKEIDVLLKEHEIICTQIREMVSYSDRILGVGVTILGAVFVYGIKEKAFEIIIATPFALTFLLLFCASVFSAILTLGGYRRYLEDAFEKKFYEPILRWEHITPKTLHSSFATTSMSVASFALLLASMYIGWIASRDNLTQQVTGYVLGGYSISLLLLFGSFLKVKRSHSDAYRAAIGRDIQLPMVGLRVILTSLPVAKRILARISEARGKDVANQVFPYINESNSVLDLGCGTGGVSLALSQKGVNVRSADILALQVHPEVAIEVIDEGVLPYRDNQFDVCLLHVTLHHVTDPELLLREASRVAKRIIVGEELVSSAMGKAALAIYDKFVNLSFVNEPHGNLSDEIWRRIFKENDLHIIDVRYSKVFLFIRQAIYVLEK